MQPSQLPENSWVMELPLAEENGWNHAAITATRE
jgi:hypothetical protein